MKPSNNSKTSEPSPASMESAKHRSVDRRRFVAASGVLAGTMALQLPTVHAAGNGQIRVGLVGCGGRGSGAAVNAMNADPAVRIVGLADLFGLPIQNCRKSLAKRYPDQFLVTDDDCYEGFDAYKRLLASEIDVVLLASPPHYRPEHMEAAVEAGKEIFCEKPVATDPDGVRRVRAACELADQKGINVVSGLCWRYDKGMQETIAQIMEDRIGTIVTTQANYLTRPVWMKTRQPGESDLEYQCRNWYNHIWLSGDHIVEQFIHSLDKALWLREDKPPLKAYGLGGRQNRSDRTQGDIYDHFSVVYVWENGTRTFAHTRQMKGCFNQTEDFVFGTDGMATLCKHRIEGLKPWRFDGEEVQMHQAEQNELFRAIRGERERINNGDYMCKSTLMAILGREVCYTGKEMTFEEIANSPQRLGPGDYTSEDAPEVRVPTPGQYTHPTA